VVRGTRRRVRHDAKPESVNIECGPDPLLQGCPYRLGRRARSAFSASKEAR